MWTISIRYIPGWITPPMVVTLTCCTSPYTCERTSVRETRSCWLRGLFDTGQLSLYLVEFTARLGAEADLEVVCLVFHLLDCRLQSGYRRLASSQRMRSELGVLRSLMVDDEDILWQGSDRCRLAVQEPLHAIDIQSGDHLCIGRGFDSPGDHLNIDAVGRIAQCPDKELLVAVPVYIPGVRPIDFQILHLEAAKMRQ